MRFVVALLVLFAPALAVAEGCPWPLPPLAIDYIKKFDAPLSNGDTHWVSWRFTGQDGVRYVCVSFGKPSDVVEFVAKYWQGTFNADEATARSQQLEAERPLPEAERATERRRIMVDYYNFPPVVAAVTAYRRRQSANAPDQYVADGTVPLGTPCLRAQGQKSGDYMRVDRDLVKPLSPIGAKPPNYYAICK